MKSAAKLSADRLATLLMAKLRHPVLYWVTDPRAGDWFCIAFCELDVQEFAGSEALIEAIRDPLEDEVVFSRQWEVDFFDDESCEFYCEPGADLLEALGGTILDRRIGHRIVLLDGRSFVEREAEPDRLKGGVLQ